MRCQRIVDERVTRTYRLRVPRYRTGYPERTNWFAVKAVDVLPLVVIAAKMPLNGGGLWTAALMLSIVWLVGRVAVRAWRRGGECDRRGWHEPYRPVEHLAVFECWHCGTPLSGDSGVVADAVAASVGRERQAAHSDRR
jgi:hypothetical protein